MNDKLYFIFDVESIGLHGEGFSVGGGTYTSNGSALSEFRLSCNPDDCSGTDEDRKWIKQNIPLLEISHRCPSVMRSAFWTQWIKAKKAGALAVAECYWPVEARFLCKCIDDDNNRIGEAPYPVHDISSILLASGIDPISKFERLPSELPIHDPLADARQSARLLSIAIAKLDPMFPQMS